MRVWSRPSFRRSLASLMGSPGKWFWVNTPQVWAGTLEWARERSSSSLESLRPQWRPENSKPLGRLRGIYGIGSMASKAGRALLLSYTTLKPISEAQIPSDPLGSIHVEENAYDLVAKDPPATGLPIS